jgi:hypothetical protein
VNTRNEFNPSAVTVRVVIPMFADQIMDPAVINNGGIAIKTAKRGINAVLEKKCLSGILDVTAKIMGIAHSLTKTDKSKIKREATIMAIMATSLAKGFIACNTPFLLLKSSM